MKIDNTKKASSHHLRAYMLRKFDGTKLAELTGSLEGRLHAYPLLQYKMLDSQPVIIGINEGAESLEEVSDKLDELYLGHVTYPVLKKETDDREAEIGPLARHKAYSFKTPWLGISDQDYNEYKYQYEAERVATLTRVMVRNILGFAKTFDCFVEVKLRVKHTLREIAPFKLGTKIPGFVGEFYVNFKLPELLGFGNMADRGFGTITEHIQQAKKPPNS